MTVYLDNASTTHPKPESVYVAMDRFARNSMANPGRAGHRMAMEAERALEALFRSGKVDEVGLAKRVRDAAALEGEFRLSHLETHRRTRALLTEEQVARYVRLRGYGGDSSSAKHGSHRH